MEFCILRADYMDAVYNTVLFVDTIWLGGDCKSVRRKVLEWLHKDSAGKYTGAANGRFQRMPDISCFKTRKADTVPERGPDKCIPAGKAAMG